MWKVQALVVHLLLLGSILSIYFQSTVLSALEPQGTLRKLGMQPPADRLVVFVTDGLRAESVLADNCSGVPVLREFMEQGLVGISRACAPTVTRPGHIAIFAGFYEDPAAALTNFGWNPTTFDTVLNRSRTALAWSDTNVAKIFSHLPTGGEPMRFDTYSKTDISGRLKMDEYVLRKVRDFMTKEQNVRPVRNTTSVVFLIHLADMDFAGHAYKPTSSKFKERLNSTQQIVREIYDLFEGVFKDNRTAYLLTADHGMTDGGHHGGGEKHEVETPLILWGSGVKRHGPESGKNFTVNNQGRVLPLHDVEQTQLAPLMSALIGLPPPKNNMAVLPLGFLNASVQYELQAMHLNTMQLLAQARILIKRHEEGIFSQVLPRYEYLNSEAIHQYSLKMAALVERERFDQALMMSQKMAKQAQQCLEYYHGYYEQPLLMATTASYILWFFCLLLQLTRESIQPRPAQRGLVTWTTLLMSFVGLLLMAAMILQNVPCLTAFYLLLPFGILILALCELPTKGALVMDPIFHLAGIVLPGGLLIVMAFHNSHIGLLYGVLACLNNRKAFLKPSVRFFSWLSLVFLLSGILIMKQNPSWIWIPDGITNYVSNSHVLYFSVVLSVVRPLVLRHRHALRVWIVNIAALLAAAYGVYQWHSDQAVCIYVYVACWAYLVFAFVSIPYSGIKEPQRRLELIIFNMLTLHIMLTISIESLFVQIMITEFVLGLYIFAESHGSSGAKDRTEEQGGGDQVEEQEQEQQGLQDLSENDDERSRKHLRLSYRFAFLILLYFYVSFFGTGNWFFNFTFKPITSRLFLSQFSLYWTAAFILLKIFIPSIIVISSIYALVTFGRQNARSILICLFLMNDAMSLYFCFFVNNRGSWQEVRESLDRLLVTHVFIILLLVCAWIAKALLRNTADEKPPSPRRVTVISESLNGDSQA